MELPNDADLLRILGTFGVGQDALIGRGGETSVYALDADRIVRIYHTGVDETTVSGRTSLLSELAQSAGKVPFAIPVVLDTARIEGRIVTIERRLPGRPLTAVLGESVGEVRVALVRAYLDASARIGDLVVDRPWYGDLSQRDPIRTTTFHEYLSKRAARSLAAAGKRFEAIDPDALAVALPGPSKPAFVHLDAFPGNMLAEGDSITSVIDFGVVAIVGDRRLDPLASAAYLASNITPTATAQDRAVAQEWLAVHGLEDFYEAAQRWLAAFWSFGIDDIRLHEWCRSILLI